MEHRKRNTRQLRPAMCYSKIENRHPASPSAIVIGAGFAGIAAARALHDASFQVIVLESQDRIGGRVCTGHTFVFPVDLGASCGDNSVLYYHDLESYALFDMDGNQVPQELVVKVDEAFDSILKETDEVRQGCNEDMSIQRAFSIVFERRPDLQLEGLAYKVLQWSFLQWRVGSVSPWGHGLMVRGLPLRYKHTRERVSKISWHHDEGRVTTESGATFVADAAVVKAPLDVLKSKSIKFEPRLPKWKEEGISDLRVRIENKIVLHFEKVFWPKVELLGAVADTTYGCNYFLNLHKATGHRVLVYMPAGKLAQDIDKMSDEVAANFAFMQLKKILPDSSPPATSALYPGSV
ncbi:hypothetical protein Nepgr_012759 [Nepenthes gracilis]|uniref:Amine oxidase domain-containing protein n=1 Tax=Nepenthes gracilis TaxID=150966 RepID=A0AAD3XND6_NEPGR|nr:hypothetical protein Nepgr_012759 [Nepenthes gracilis]